MTNLASVYNSLSATYEQKYVEGGWDNNPYMYDEKIANKQFTESKLAGKIVSIGCGSGQDIPICNMPSKDNFVGYDVSTGMLANAKAKFPEHTFIEHDCNVMTNDTADILVCMFGAGNYLGLPKLLEHYKNLNATSAFFVFYNEHYVDGVADSYHTYTQAELEALLAEYNPTIADLWNGSNYYVVYWNEV